MNNRLLSSTIYYTGHIVKPTLIVIWRIFTEIHMYSIDLCGQWLAHVSDVPAGALATAVQG